MRTYVMTTGTIFALLAGAHVWRALEEGRHVAGNPSFVLITIVSAALSLWACRLVWRR